jgi:hypothetical protein
MRFFDGSGDVFDRDLGVDAVLVEQVDVVGAQPSQRALDGLGEVLWAAIEPGAGGAVVAEAELGGNHDLIADGREPFADDVFVAERPVRLGRVEERDAAVDGGAQHRDRSVALGGLAVVRAQAHAAVTNRRDL